ncbi:hypothetical protein ACGFMO_25750 [Streptomyces niveus]|uniref:hypothetical protein n=1 Tax=Streptomyces niveus TaxID=193462 RepID=UPI00371634FF
MNVLVRAVARACAAAVIAATVVGGCAVGSECRAGGERPRDLTGNDLIGTYRHSDLSIVLSGDGKFTTQGWPTDVDGPPRKVGSGTWELTAEGDSGFPVSLSFHEIGGFWDSDTKGGYYGAGLYVEGDREDPRLYEFLGDPDACDVQTFSRTSSS